MNAIQTMEVVSKTVSTLLGHITASVEMATRIPHMEEIFAPVK